jgi:ketosteroid isomerase-like protein
MVQQTITQNSIRLAEAYNRGDVAAVAAMYTDDAVVLPPNLPMQEGRQAIEGFWTLARQIGMRDLSLQTGRVEESGDAAWEVGVYSLKIQPEGAAPVEDKGKYVVVWKRAGDGSWKLAVDIWNTDSPPVA